MWWSLRWCDITRACNPGIRASLAGRPKRTPRVRFCPTGQRGRKNSAQRADSNVSGGGHTHPRPKFGAAMGLHGHARTGHASSPGPPVIDPRRYVFSNATRPPASVRPVASSQSACALGAPPSPSMPAAASTPAWRADWAAARRHSWRPLDARPLAPLKGGHNGAAATTASIAIATAAATATTFRPPQPSHGVLQEGQARPRGQRVSMPVATSAPVSTTPRQDGLAAATNAPA
jgi:hypothetical protein